MKARLRVPLLIITSCLLFLSLFMGCFRSEVKNMNSEGKSIVCFGDSLTLGYGAGSGEDYPAALAGLLGKPVINMGVDGETSAEALKRIKADVLDREPLLVIIEFGGNDFLTKVSRQETMRNIKEMIRKIHEEGAMVAVVDISAGMFLSEYREDFSRLAKEERAIFIPAVLDGIITNPSMKSDFLHPNGEGYKMIARKIFRSIKPCLEKNEYLLKHKK